VTRQSVTGWSPFDAQASLAAQAAPHGNGLSAGSALLLPTAPPSGCDTLLALMSVLVVEDDAELREMMTLWLASHGIGARTARNGLAALAELRRRPHPKVVLLDLMMPVMDGWEFRRQQLRDPFLAHIPVVVVSALTLHDSAELAPTAVVPKPCDFDRLLAIVKRFV
jgi:CheY-like chemotaxis protein